ncbi:MAG: hypothetical protein AAGA03_17465 [Planctomycetota bacterium]
MFAGSLVLSATVIGFALWLHFTDQQGWPGETYSGTKVDLEYLRRRSRSRRRVHMILLATGVLIGVAAFAGPDETAVWLACWLSVIAALLTVVGLALLDAFRTHRYHRNKLPEIRKRALGTKDD